MKVLLLSTFCCTLYAQAIVEAAIGTARAGTTTAPAAATGKAISGVFSNLDKALKGAPAASPIPSSTSTSGGSASSASKVGPAAPAKPAGPPKIYEDIKKVEVGLEYDELINRFGPPALEIAGGDGLRKLNYSNKEG